MAQAPAVSEPAPVKAVQEFLSAGSWQAQRALIRKCPALVAPATEQMMSDWLQDNPDSEPALISAVLHTRVVLARCRVVGVDAAFAEFEAQHPQVNTFSELLILKHVGEAYDQAPQELPVLIDLIWYWINKTPEDAEPNTILEWCLGLAYHKLERGDRANNLEIALIYLMQFLISPQVQDTGMNVDFPYQVLNAALGEAVFVLRLERPLLLPAGLAGLLREFLLAKPKAFDSQAWAGLYMALGIARWQETECDPDQLGQFVEYFETALSMLSETRYHNDAALARMCLGDACILRSDGVRMENIETALAYYHAAEDALENFFYPVQWAHLCARLGRAYLLRRSQKRRDEFDTATEWLEKAGSAFASGLVRTQWGHDEYELLTRLHYDLGIANLQRHGPEYEQSGLGHLDAALEGWTAEKNPADWGWIQLHLGDFYGLRDQENEQASWGQILNGEQTDYGRALDCYRNVVENVSPEEAPELWAWAAYRLGSAIMQAPTGKAAEEAIELFQGAADIFTREAMPDRWIEIQVRLASAFGNQIIGAGEVNTAAAERCLAQALTAQDPLHYHHRYALRYLGSTQFIHEQWAAANETYEKVFAMADFALAHTLTDQGRRKELSNTSRFFARSAYCLLKLGRPGEALLRFEQGKTRLIALSLNPAESVLARLEAPVRDELLAAKALWADAVYEKDTIAFGTSGRFSENMVSRMYLQAGQAMAEALARIPAAFFEHQAHRMTEQMVLRLIPEGGALVVPLVAGRGTAVFILPHAAQAVGEEHLLWLDFPESELRYLLLGQGILSYGWLSAYYQKPKTIVVPEYQEFTGSAPPEMWVSLLEQALDKLWGYLMGPVHTRLQALGLQEGAPVTIIPDAELSLFPLHAAWRWVDEQQRAFLDEYTVSYAPSLYVLAESRRRAQAAVNAPAGALLVVDPQDNLRFARLEAALVAPRMAAENPATLTGAEASLARVRAAYPGKHYLHFACHGTFEPARPLDSALLLAKGERFTLGSEWAGEKLAGTRLVVLSACDTAMSEVDKLPDELIGFSTLQLQAGAAGVVTALWEVNDLSTVLLMEKFYENLRQAGSPAQALRHAQLWMRDARAGELTTLLAARRSTMTEYYEQLSQAWRYFAAMEEDARPYAFVYHWAGFQFSGA